MKLNQWIQQEGESAESFNADLYELSEACNYEELTEEMIWDKFVFGICHDAMAECIQIDPELNLI